MFGNLLSDMFLGAVEQLTPETFKGPAFKKPGLEAKRAMLKCRHDFDDQVKITSVRVDNRPGTPAGYHYVVHVKQCKCGEVVIDKGLSPNS